MRILSNSANEGKDTNEIHLLEIISASNPFEYASLEEKFGLKIFNHLIEKRSEVLVQNCYDQPGRVETDWQRSVKTFVLLVGRVFTWDSQWTIQNGWSKERLFRLGRGDLAEKP